ncbi:MULTISPECIES: FG-GAP-like repeat-containing protein [Streptomyces]|uniref:FG-GAP-like repeat-containing protein n=1 Tax=Streptomyces TaxID=1883 RepID=UPI00069B13EE|nr:hypothetical protein [Streptomyces sp. SID7805]
MREWFSGLSETGKVALVVAVITTFGGGVFGVVNAVISTSANSNDADKPGKGTSTAAAHGGDPTSRNNAADSKPDESKMRLCNEYPGGWDESDKEIAPDSRFDADKEYITFADIDGDGRDDYLVVNRDTGAVRVWNNLRNVDGKFKWGRVVSMTSGVDGFDAEKEDIDFADIDGDGRDEYLVVNHETGAVKAWKCSGDDQFGPPKWRIDARIPNNMGKGAMITFADIDGNGRDDYLMVDTASGAVQAWLNLGSNQYGQLEWKHLENVISDGLNGGQLPTFHNVDCDKRADYLVETTKGPLNARMNRGAASDGKFVWEKEVQIANGGGLDGKTVRREFADLNGDGRDDILWIKRKTGVVIKTFINNGGDRDPV